MRMVYDNMKFMGYHGFYKERYKIRSAYQRLSSSGKYLYKYYVYSRRYLKERTCNIMWEFLNCADDFEMEVIDSKLYDEWFRYKM